MTPSGLTQAEAEARLSRDGYNELPSAKSRSPLKVIAGVLTEPMFALLMAAAAVYFMIGSAVEAALIGMFASLSVVITVVQELRSEKVLEALRDLTSPRALVLRDGEKRRIAGREIAQGDLVFLLEGDRVPADAALEPGDSLLVDESLLTGESIAVHKSSGADGVVHAGTLVVNGSGRALVTATGRRSEIGKIGQSLRMIETEQPRLQQQTRWLVKVFGSIGLVVSLSFVLLDVLLRGKWAEALLGGIALGMSMLPEEFPLVLTVFTVMGAWRISRAGVLTRKAAAIETLGSATVLCTDKTGTLTQNRMTVACLRRGNGEWHQMGEGALAGELQELLSIGAKACKHDSHDPVDMAFTGTVPPARPARHYGVSPEWPVMVNCYPAPGGGFTLAAKGAPEAIARLCGFDAAAIDALNRDMAGTAAKGVRLIAIASGEFKGAELPAVVSGFRLTFEGLAGLADPLRPEVPQAVAECRAAGIRVIMMTGDYPATAAAIASAAGIGRGDVLTGSEVAALSDDALKARLRHVDVFARIKPDQKLRIVELLKASGEVVAMTGDGVNDAPSLKVAHIGIAMGGRGTDVAREAASIVLLNDDFASLVKTVRLGRRVYDNLRKAIVYIIAVHIPIAGLTLMPFVFGLPLIMTPLLIALIEMVIDPACSLVLEAEPEERDVMNRPPHDPKANIVTPALIAWGVLQGVLALVVVAGVMFTAAKLNLPETEIRSLSFVLLLTCNVALILANRSFSPSILAAFRSRNPALAFGAVTVTAIFSMLLLWPPAARLFGFGPIHGHDFAICLVGGVLLLAGLEGCKRHVVARLKA